MVRAAGPLALCPKPEILPAAPRLRACVAGRNARARRLRINEWAAIDCAAQQCQAAKPVCPMNRSPSATSSSTIHRSGSELCLRARYWLKSSEFSASCRRVQVQIRCPAGCGMGSKRRAGPPFSVRTTRIDPASRSPLCSTAAKPPAAATARIRPATSRWAGKRGFRPRPSRSSSPAGRRVPRCPELRSRPGAWPRPASVG